VRTLGFIKLKRSGERVQDVLRDPVQVPPLKPGVVVDADSGEQCDLLAAESRDAPVAAVGR
jgi:hypothetical protein